MELSPIEKLAYETVDEIQGIKRDNGQSPDFATLTEVHNSFKAELLESLRSLYRKGIIEHHKTVNGVPMFGIKQQQ